MTAIESTYGDGRVVKVCINADRTYSIGLPNGQTVKGIWQMRTGKAASP